MTIGRRSAYLLGSHAFMRILILIGCCLQLEVACAAKDILLFKTEGEGAWEQAKRDLNHNDLVELLRASQNEDAHRAAEQIEAKKSNNESNKGDGEKAHSDDVYSEAMVFELFVSEIHVEGEGKLDKIPAISFYILSEHGLEFENDVQLPDSSDSIVHIRLEGRSDGSSIKCFIRRAPEERSHYPSAGQIPLERKALKENYYSAEVEKEKIRGVEVKYNRESGLLFRLHLDQLVFKTPALHWSYTLSMGSEAREDFQMEASGKWTLNTLIRYSDFDVKERWTMREALGPALHSNEHHLYCIVLHFNSVMMWPGTDGSEPVVVEARGSPDDWPLFFMYLFNHEEEAFIWESTMWIPSECVSGVEKEEEEEEEGSIRDEMGETVKRWRHRARVTAYVSKEDIGRWTERQRTLFHFYYLMPKAQPEAQHIEEARDNPPERIEFGTAEERRAVADTYLLSQVEFPSLHESAYTLELFPYEKELCLHGNIDQLQFVADEQRSILENVPTVTAPPLPTSEEASREGVTAADKGKGEKMVEESYNDGFWGFSWTKKRGSNADRHQIETDGKISPSRVTIQERDQEQDDDGKYDFGTWGTSRRSDKYAENSTPPQRSPQASPRPPSPAPIAQLKSSTRKGTQLNQTTPSGSRTKEIQSSASENRKTVKVGKTGHRDKDGQEARRGGRHNGNRRNDDAAASRSQGTRRRSDRKNGDKTTTGKVRTHSGRPASSATSEIPKQGATDQPKEESDNNGEGSNPNPLIIQQGERPRAKHRSRRMPKQCDNGCVREEPDHPIVSRLLSFFCCSTRSNPQVSSHTDSPAVSKSAGGGKTSSNIPSANWAAADTRPHGSSSRHRKQRDRSPTSSLPPPQSAPAKHRPDDSNAKHDSLIGSGTPRPAAGKGERTRKREKKERELEKPKRNQ